MEFLLVANKFPPGKIYKFYNIIEFHNVYVKYLTI